MLRVGHGAVKERKRGSRLKGVKYKVRRSPHIFKKFTALLDVEYQKEKENQIQVFFRQRKKNQIFRYFGLCFTIHDSFLFDFTYITMD